METGVIGLWEQAVQLLQDATKDPASHKDAASHDTVLDLAAKLASLPPSQSDWEQLLQQQVRIALHQSRHHC